MTYCKVSSIDTNCVQEAVNIRHKDFEDSIQYYSAASEHAEVIITRDKKGFEGFPIEVMTPADFINSCI